jgi:hypothetical protein
MVKDAVAADQPLVAEVLLGWARARKPAVPAQRGETEEVTKPPYEHAKAARRKSGAASPGIGLPTLTLLAHAGAAPLEGRSIREPHALFRGYIRHDLRHLHCLTRGHLLNTDHDLVICSARGRLQQRPEPLQ